ncbi:MAG: NAD(P)/FAD-dependent oxidoreductase [Candidatus Acidiferrales bacterium]
MNIQADVVVVGAGPAGIAAALAANAKGFRCLAVEAQTPPIDKPCGEGLLPHGVAALRDLGIRLNPEIAIPFHGIRFCDRESSSCARFPDGVGFGLRRLRLHQLLVDAATRAGVSFLWGSPVTSFERGCVIAGGNTIRYQWLIGADGQNSRVRRWAGLDSHTFGRRRFGFRQHFQIRPCVDMVEVYWGKGCQVVVTPTGAEEVCVTVFSRDPQLRIDPALPQFPALAERLRVAPRNTREAGNLSSMTRLRAVTKGRVALIGDASGTVDAITGHGLSLSFQQALHLAEAIEQGQLWQYESAHREIRELPATMTHLMLILAGSDWIRERTLRLFQDQPDLFSELLSANTGSHSLSAVGATEVFSLGWKLLWV